VAVDLDSGPGSPPARPGGAESPRVAGVRVAGVRLAADLATLLSGAEPDQVVGVDMPLGLLDEGWRLADREARALLGPRRSSIFAIPPGPVWRESGYAAANERCRALTGAGFSVQAWGLRRKLIEANRYRLRCRHPLYEVHPELSFSAMAGGPLRHPKHSRPGHAERRAVLAAAGIELPGEAGLPGEGGLAGEGGLPERDRAALRRVAVDVLDAAAAAWTALRIAAGRARTLPDPPQTDAHGHEVAIRY